MLGNRTAPEEWLRARVCVVWASALLEPEGREKLTAAHVGGLRTLCMRRCEVILERRYHVREPRLRDLAMGRRTIWQDWTAYLFDWPI